MLRSMSSRTLAEWMAYSSLEPYGDELIDTHFAQLTAMVELLRRPKATKLELERFKFWKKIEAQVWNPQTFFDDLKSAFSNVRKDE